MKRKKKSKIKILPSIDPRPAKSYSAASGRFSHSWSHIINLILNWLDMQQYKQWRIFLFSSLLTCCRYVATPGLASSARNIVHCLKPNCLGTRPRSSIPLCVRTYYVCERNLSKEEAHGGPGRPGTCNPRTSGTCSAKREGATRAHPEK